MQAASRVPFAGGGPGGLGHLVHPAQVDEVAERHAQAGRQLHRFQIVLKRRLIVPWQYDGLVEHTDDILPLDERPGVAQILANHRAVAGSLGALVIIHMDEQHPEGAAQIVQVLGLDIIKQRGAQAGLIGQELSHQLQFAQLRHHLDANLGPDDDGNRPGGQVEKSLVLFADGLAHPVKRKPAAVAVFLHNQRLFHPGLAGHGLGQGLQGFHALVLDFGRIAGQKLLLCINEADGVAQQLRRHPHQGVQVA